MTTITRSLWDHQKESWIKARELFKKGFRAILIQGVTGTGKTRMVAAIIRRAISRHRPGQNHIPESKRQYQNVWFIVPRRELLWQSGKELEEWKIDNQIISGGKQQSPAFNTYIWSRDTLIRRVRDNKVRVWPDLIIFDEAHIALNQQLEIKAAAGPDTIILGVTATPERLDGRPLLGMYDVAVMGEQMQYFVENKFLKRPWVLSIPKKDRLDGLSDLKTNKAGDVNAKSLMELYKARAQGKSVVYGNEIEHYREHGQGRSFLIFCRNLVQAEEVAEEFNKDGIRCESIDGTMTDKVRRDKISRVESGALLGLTTVDLCTYGLDVPKISCLILLRLTDSVSLFFQMIGRGLRWDGEFDNCLILDHVGNCDETKHGHPLLPRSWNFEGREKKEKLPKDFICKVEALKKCKICFGKIIRHKKCARCETIFDEKLAACPSDGFEDGTYVGACEFCGAADQARTLKPMVEIDGNLVEINCPTKLKERPPENQRHYQSLIAVNKDKFRLAWYGDGEENKGGEIDEEAVKNLVEAYKEIKRQPFSIYYDVRQKGDKTINVSLLFAIEKAAGYKNGWAWFKRKELERSA